MSESIENCLQDGIAISQHVGIPEAEDAVTLACKPLGSLDVTRGFLLGGVLTAIQLDHEVPIVTDKIDNEGPHWHLAPKAKSMEAVRSQP